MSEINKYINDNHIDVSELYKKVNEMRKRKKARPIAYTTVLNALRGKTKTRGVNKRTIIEAVKELSEQLRLPFP